MITKIDITDTSLVDSVRDKMKTATPTAKGLLGAGILGSLNVSSSVLLCETTLIPVTGSLLLSVAVATSNAPNLYYIAINRTVGNTGNPNVKVKVLSGSYLIKIKGKTDADGKCRIYAERLQYTPLFDVLVQNSYGITLKMETAENSAFDGGFEATVE